MRIFESRLSFSQVPWLTQMSQSFDVNGRNGLSGFLRTRESTYSAQ